MAMIECSVCGQMAQSRTSHHCSDCGAPLCDDCANNTDGLCEECCDNDRY